MERTDECWLSQSLKEREGENISLDKIEMNNFLLQTLIKEET